MLCARTMTRQIRSCILSSSLITICHCSLIVEVFAVLRPIHHLQKLFAVLHFFHNGLYGTGTSDLFQAHLFTDYFNNYSYKCRPNLGPLTLTLLARRAVLPWSYN